MIRRHSEFARAFLLVTSLKTSLCSSGNNEVTDFNTINSIFAIGISRDARCPFC